MTTQRQAEDAAGRSGGDGPAADAGAADDSGGRRRRCELVPLSVPGGAGWRSGAVADPDRCGLRRSTCSSCWRRFGGRGRDLRLIVLGRTQDREHIQSGDRGGGEGVSDAHGERERDPDGDRDCAGRVGVGAAEGAGAAAGSGSDGARSAAAAAGAEVHARGSARCCGCWWRGSRTGRSRKRWGSTRDGEGARGAADAEGWGGEPDGADDAGGWSGSWAAGVIR